MDTLSWPISACVANYEKNLIFQDLYAAAQST